MINAMFFVALRIRTGMDCDELLGAGNFGFVVGRDNGINN
jgi:hypothetical protein